MTNSLSIRLAQQSDLLPIMNLVSQAVAIMLAEGNEQWDHQYPVREDFLQDIQQQSLYICEQNEAILGFICLNQSEHPDYHALNWSSDESSLIIHRMLVSPQVRRQGIGSCLMNFAEDLALMRGLHSIRTDTYSVNEKMKGLFNKYGYHMVGHLDFGKPRLFIAYEKNL